MIEILRNKLKNNQELTIDETAFLIKNDVYSKLKFLMDNNLASINDTLKYKLGYSDLPFEPNRKKIEGYIDLMIKSGDKEKLQFIVNNFLPDKMVNNYTTSPELLKKLKGI